MIIRISDQLRCGEISLFEVDQEEAEAAKNRLDVRREKLTWLMAEWVGPGKGFVFIAVPPAPGRLGYTIFQPMVSPDAQGRQLTNRNSKGEHNMSDRKRERIQISA
jgi:hypothetical protein